MKVKELINELKKYDQEAEVVINDPIDSGIVESVQYLEAEGVILDGNMDLPDLQVEKRGE